jgi:glycosyltransferase involved in cell wall biosynthesis
VNQDGQILPGTLRSELDDIGRTDILVGIPSFNSASTLPHVITAVEAGLRKSFPDLRSVIVISDGGSSDRTVEAAMASGVGDNAERYLVDPSTPAPRKVAFTYRGIPGKGSAFRSVFEVARHLDAQACAVVDSDLRSITPAWLDRLLTPLVSSGFDFVAPVYARHKYDGTITNSIAYPLTTALYGTRLRQPIGGEFGFSGKLAGNYASKEVWDTDVARFGIDIWMTTVAVVEAFRVCQANLGAKLHDPKDPGADLGPMFRQVVGSLFALAGTYREPWMTVDGVMEPPTFGLRAAFSVEPINVSLTRLIWKLVEGYVRHQETWRQVMTVETYAEVLGSISEASERPAGFSLPIDLWFRIVYEFLVAYNRRRVDPGELLDSLIPLYFARTASYVQEVTDLTTEDAGPVVDGYVDVALQYKPYLARRWEHEHVPVRDLSDQPVPETAEHDGMGELASRIV